MLFASWEVRIGKNCARGLDYGLRPHSRPRAQFFPLRTDLSRQITCLFFSSVEYFVSSFCVGIHVCFLGHYILEHVQLANQI